MQARTHTGRIATAGLAGVAALALGGGLVAGASTAGASTARKAKATSGGSLAALEQSLSKLEAGATGGTLTETGSSLFYPLFSTWAQSYHGSTLQTASTGSGAGQSGAESGTVDIGASDAYLPPSTLSATGSSAVEDIPVVVSAQQIDYNLPGLAKGTHLKLDAKVLDGMYTGQITSWDDPAVKALNPGVALPSTKIVPLHRSDSSGDTFLFSSYLDYQDPSSFVAQSGPGTTVNFPDVPGAIAAKGNSGMLATCKTTPGCVAYIGVSYLRSALKDGLGDAELLNGSGNYVVLTPQNIVNEIASYKHIPSNGAISLVDSKTAPHGYPIVNFEYAIVKTDQPSSSTAASIKALLAWGMDPRHGSASSFLAAVDFQPLPANALAVATKLVQSIH